MVLYLFSSTASPSDIQYGPQGVPMLSPLELAEIMNAQSNQNDGGFDGPYNGPQRPAQPSQGQPVYGRRPSGPPNQGPRQYDRQPESEENYDEDNNSGYEDGRNDNFASSPPRGHASSGYRQPAPQEDERDQGGYSNEHPEDNRGYAAPQRPREPERPQSVSRYRVRTPSYDNRNRDAQPDTRGSRNNENFRPVDEDARYNRQGSTPITAAGGFDVPPRNSYRVNINNRQNNRNNVPHPDRGSSSYAYNTMHDQRPRESSREEDDDREDERPNDYGRSPSEQRPQSTYGYYNSEDYSQPGNNNNNANNNYPNNNYSNQVNNNYSNSYNGDNNGSGGFQPSTRNFAPSHHHHHHHHHQGSNEFIDNRNRNRRRFYPNHHNQRNHY